MDAVAPGGNPVDDIDRACRQHHVCTTCLSDKHKVSSLSENSKTCIKRDFRNGSYFRRRKARVLPKTIYTS